MIRKKWWEKRAVQESNQWCVIRLENVIIHRPNMMAGILLYGFAAALLGGIDNPWGAVLGGVILGVLENLLGAYVIGSDLKLTMALILTVTILIFRPYGLFGKPIFSRV